MVIPKTRNQKQNVGDFKSGLLYALAISIGITLFVAVIAYYTNGSTNPFLYGILALIIFIFMTIVNLFDYWMNP